MVAVALPGALNAAASDPARLPSAVLAVFVHVLLFVVLFFGMRWSTSVPDAVVVELWNPAPVIEPAPVPEKVEPPPKVEPAPKPVPRIAPKAEPRPVPAVKKPDIAVEKEKPKPKPKPQAPVPDLRFDMNAQMKQELARELAKSTPRPEAAKPAPASAPVIDNAYAGRIRARIRGYIIVPPDIVGDPEAIFDVVQLPTGEVFSARLRKPSGNKAYDDAIERAILKASPLPRPDKPEQFQRQLELKFRPKDPV